MAMAIRCFGKLKILAIHFEFGHSLILAIRWSGVHHDAEIPARDLLFDNIMAKIIYGAFDGAIYSVLDK